MRQNMLDPFYFVDFKVLNLAVKLVVFLRDWVAIDQRWIERVLIAIYGGGFIANSALLWREGEHPHYVFALLLPALVTLAMWREHAKATNQSRLQKLVTPLYVIVRVLALYLLATCCLLNTFAKPHRWHDATTVLSLLSYTAYMYISALPHDGGEKGSKAKLAADKLKELFGTSWVVQPIPVPR